MDFIRLLPLRLRACDNLYTTSSHLIVLSLRWALLASRLHLSSLRVAPSCIIRRIWCEPPLLKETSHQLKVSAADKYHSNNNRRHSPSDEPEDQYISVKRPQPHPCGQWSFLSPPIIPLPAATALSRVHGPRRGYKELGQSYWDEKPSCLSSATICTNGRYLLDPFFLT